KNQGLRIYTTLDLDVQRMAQRTMTESKPVFDQAEAALISGRDSKKEGRVEAALLVTEPQSGHVLAMVGGRDYKTSQYNRAAASLRSPGSAFKPVVFSEALKRGLKWSDLIYVAPVAVEDYRPRNVDQ